MNPIQGYRPPTLTGHKDTIVGVMFAGAKAAAAAQLEGATPPDLFTVSRDGALFTWAFEPAEQPAEAPVAPASAGTDRGTPADGAAEGKGDAAAEQPRKRQRIAATTGPNYAGVWPEPSRCCISWIVAEQYRTPPALDGVHSRGIRDNQAGRGFDTLEVPHRAAVGPAAGRWRLGEKRYFDHRGAQLSAVAFHRSTSLMVAAFSSGVFELYQVGSIPGGCVPASMLSPCGPRCSTF